MGFWLERSFCKDHPEWRHTIVDCGYVKHPKARENAKRLLAAIGNKGKRNCTIAGAGRILVRVPPTKRPVLKRFRAIRRPGRYCWTTHKYGKGEQFALKYAA